MAELKYHTMQFIFPIPWQMRDLHLGHITRLPMQKKFSICRSKEKAG